MEGCVCANAGKAGRGMSWPYEAVMHFKLRFPNHRTLNTNGRIPVEGVVHRGCVTYENTSGRYPYMKIKSLGGVKIKWLVLLCIEADFCIQIRILQHFSRSTRFAILRTAANWIFIIFYIFVIFSRFLQSFC